MPCEGSAVIIRPEVASAFNDSRFTRIRFDEIPLLKCSVTLLYNFKENKTYLDWTVQLLRNPSDASDRYARHNNILSSRSQRLFSHISTRSL